MIVLDTNVISEIFRPQPDTRVVTWLESLTGDVAITAVTLAELLAGVRRLPAGRRRSTLQGEIDAALQRLTVTQGHQPSGMPHHQRVMGCRDDRNAALVIESAEQRQQIFRGLRIEIGTGFICQQQHRITHECTCDGNPLLLATA